ncbi:MAG: hypothetical protein EOO90_02600 [Pedobacter sp.]|nr:MAG: hypothetical protein EOO90_02600 [Pedobacter sp.]
MELNFKLRVKDAIPLCYLNAEELLISIRNRLFIYNLESNNKKHLLDLPASPLNKLLSSFKLTSRVLRLGVRYAIPITEDEVLLVFNNQFYEVNVRKGIARESFKLERGNRPLNIATIRGLEGFADMICFGEYFYNPDKKPIHVYQRIAGTSEWKIVYTFVEGEIDHVHALVPDHFRSCIWILTGDLGCGAAIWKAENNFEKVSLVKGGEQIFRSCNAFPTEEGLVYATDSEFETNTIRILKEVNGDWESQKICEINGPAIYGCQVNDLIFFSTSVEGNSVPKGKIMMYFDRQPALGVKDNYSHIVGGNIKKGFSILDKNEKDIYPFVLFQFGAVTFPTGTNLSNKLVSYNRSLKRNGFDMEIFNIN